MAELEDMINGLLSDPEQMNMISSLAQSLMGGEAPRSEGRPEGAQGEVPELLRQLMGGGEKPGSSTGLLRAMQPYLSEKRRLKMDKALKLARLAKLAGFAMEDMGGEK